MAVQTPPPCYRFFRNLSAMKDPLVNALAQCKNAPSSLISVDVVKGAFDLLAFFNHQELLDTFIQRTYMHWELIAASTDVGPILDGVLGGFQELGKDRIAEIQRVVKDKEVDIAIQKQLLDLGKSLVKISIRHLHASGSTLVDVKRMAKLYDLDLEKK